MVGMTDTTPETPADDRLFIEMRKGDKFVRVYVGGEEEPNLSDASFQQLVMKSLTKGMIASGAVRVPLSDVELRQLATRKAYDLIKAAEHIDHGSLAAELGISVEDATKVAALTAAATPFIN